MTGTNYEVVRKGKYFSGVIKFPQSDQLSYIHRTIGNFNITGSEGLIILSQ
jgi:hypothetical protein